MKSNDLISVDFLIIGPDIDRSEPQSKVGLLMIDAAKGRHLKALQPVNTRDSLLSGQLRN